jgi:hypothetical protein
MIPNIALKEKELFDEWRIKTSNLSEDGLIDYTSYINSKLKILYLLKEVNSEEGFNLKDFVKQGGRTQTWDNIARWTYGILNHDKNFEWDEIEKIKNKDLRREWLKFIGVMNIKKTPGGHTANSKALWKGSSQGKDFLQRQFDLYYENKETRPDIIIACGTETSNFFHEIVPFATDKYWLHTKRGVPYYEFETDNYFVKYAHPEARVSDNLLFYGLIDAIRELKGST